MTDAALAQVLAALAAVALVAGIRALALATPAGGPTVLRALAGSRWVRGAGEALVRAGLPLAPGAAVAAAAAACTGAGLLCFAAIGHPVAVAAPAVAAVAAVRRLGAGAVRRHAHRVARQLPAAARELAVSVAAGLSLRQGIARAAADAPEPLAGELRRVAAELAVGATVEEALDAFATRMRDADVGLMVTAVLVQRRTGGDMARALAELAERLQDRVALQRELRGATAQARATAWLVAAMPGLGGVALQLAAPGVVARTLGTGAGRMVLVAAIALDVAGIVLVRRIARVEP